MVMEILIEKGIITNGEIEAKVQAYAAKYIDNSKSISKNGIQPEKSRSDESNSGCRKSGLLSTESDGRNEPRSGNSTKIIKGSGYDEGHTNDGSSNCNF